MPSPLPIPRTPLQQVFESLGTEPFTTAEVVAACGLSHEVVRRALLELWARGWVELLPSVREGRGRPARRFQKVATTEAA